MNDSFTPLQPKVVLGIVAHPDDLDVGAGGTMAFFAANGAKIHYLILTDGGKGSDDEHITSKELTDIRRQEQRDALAIIGGHNVNFLDYPDGELEVSMALKKDIVKEIRAVKPDVVVTLDPTLVYSAKNGIINHPDHRAAGQATLDAVFPLARDHLTFPDLLVGGLHPHKTPTLLLINFDQGNFYVDITDTFETKLNALAVHESQFKAVRESTWLKDMAAQQGILVGYPLAESFVRIDIR
ncbi:PIG-L family deacetylase [Candidatus Saccharibacteria bacterium]|nr:PIG-L family deacetylase [Candidatus Saccharibacteria bacterium]